MKTLKRLLLRPFYAIYWLWARFVKNELYIKTFNNWLSANGFWRLSTALDNFKVIVPKEYREFVGKYPLTHPYVYPVDTTRYDKKPNDAKIFYHWEEKK